MTLINLDIPETLFRDIKITDIITILVALLTVIVAYLSYKSSKTTSKLYIDQIIQTSLQNYRNHCQLLITQTFDDQDKLDIFNKLKGEFLEDICNSFNRACSIYNQGFWIFSTIDKKLFRTDRKTEILILFSNTEYLEIIGPELKSDYKDLISVYKEFTK